MLLSEPCNSPMPTRRLLNRINRLRGFSLSLGLGLILLLCGCHQPLLQAQAPSPAIAQVQVAPSSSGQLTYPRQITVEELAQRIEAGDPSYWLIDVRTAEEVAIATLPTSTHIPLAQITNGTALERIQTERGERQVILHCYSGVRSRRAQKQLDKVGIATTDLKGGIKAWRDRIDSSLPQKLLP